MNFHCIGKCAITALMAIPLTACFESKEVLRVQEGKLHFCSKATVKSLVDGFMGSPSWSSGTDGLGNTYVSVEGDITYREAQVRAVLQFILDGDSFYNGPFEMNGVPTDHSIAIALMEKMCASVKD